MRNLVAHGYDRVNLKVVWETINDDLPPLVSLLRSVLEVEGSD